MNNKKLIVGLIFTAVATVVITALTDSFSNIFQTVVSFPFIEIAVGLSWVAKHGRIGNGLAVALLIMLAMVPAFVGFISKDKKTGRLTRAGLIVLSFVLLFVFGGMINPWSIAGTSLERIFAGAQIRTLYGVLGWSAIVLAVVFAIVDFSKTDNSERLYMYLKILLYAFSFALVIIASFTGTHSFIEQYFREESTGDRIFVALRVAAYIVPRILDVLIFVNLVSLLNCVTDEDRQNIGGVSCKINRLCRLSLCTEVAVVLLMNLCELLFMNSLSKVYTYMEIPGISIGFAALVLLVSQLLIENRKLRDDNDLFI